MQWINVLFWIYFSIYMQKKVHKRPFLILSLPCIYRCMWTFPGKLIRFWSGLLEALKVRSSTSGRQPADSLPNQVEQVREGTLFRDGSQDLAIMLPSKRKTAWNHRAMSTMALVLIQKCQCWEDDMKKGKSKGEGKRRVRHGVKME